MRKSLYNLRNLRDYSLHSARSLRRSGFFVWDRNISAFLDYSAGILRKTPNSEKELLFSIDKVSWEEGFVKNKLLGVLLSIILILYGTVVRVSAETV